MLSPEACPCGGRFVQVLYGRPSHGMRRKAQEGLAVLGGCTLTAESPARACVACGKGDGSTMRAFVEALEKLFTKAKEPNADPS